MSAEPDVLIEPAGSRQVELVAEILADAFREDAVTAWISRDPQFPKWMWLLVTPLVLPYKEAYVTADGSGAALWLPPGVQRDMLPGLDKLMEGLWRFGAGAFFRFFQFMSTLEKYHPKERHYYLFAVGVRSGSRGRGVGSALLNHVLQKCDRQKVGAYLESSNPRNIALYQRLGFEIQRTINLPRNGPAISLMYRKPQSA